MSDQPEFDYDLKIIPVDDNLLNKLSEYLKDGWQVVPNVKPVALYHMVKAKPQQAQTDTGGAFGAIVIDESKVHILRPDGSLA